MSAITCAIQGIYNIICRHPETAEGGISPQNKDLHASSFARCERDTLTRLTGNAFDRSVQILFEGTDSITALASTVTGYRQRTVMLTIQVGYFVGDHEAASTTVIAQDDGDIIRELSKSINWPDCQTGCINGIIPINSIRTVIDDSRQMLEFRVQVILSN